MHNGVTLLHELRRLIFDDGFALSILAVVGVTTILAFGFDATFETIASLLIIGVATALVERNLRARR